MTIIYIGSFIVLAVLIYGIVRTIKNNKRKKKSEVSFKEAIDLAGIPVVTFVIDGNKYNFLMDTGSTDSHINRELLNKINHKECNYTKEVFGIEGNVQRNEYYSIIITYKKMTFVENFSAIDLTSAFDSVKKESGVQLHGILGNSFFEKYKYVIDYKDLTAYIK